MTVEGITPNSSTLINLEEGEYAFVLNLRSIFEHLHLVFVANDSRGAVAMLEPTVEICACANEGICTRNGLITSNSTIILNCQCTEGTQCFIMHTILALIIEVLCNIIIILSSLL